jgi:CHASE2 domain-containing sensor protein
MSRSPKKRDKEPERFYLLPGQGGASFRRKRRILITWSVVAALVFSGVLTGLFYLMNRPSH